MTSPFLPTRKLLTSLYLPPPAEVPAGDLYVIPYRFDDLPGYGSDELSKNVLDDLLLYQVAARCVLHADGLTPEPFRYQLYHAHGSQQVQLFSAHLVGSAGAGAPAGLPVQLPTTYLIGRGDRLTVEVKPMVNLACDLELALWFKKVNR